MYRNTLLPHVLRAVATLREAGGSTASNISRYVLRHYKHSQRSASRDRHAFSLRMRQTLRDAVKSGVLKKRSGKFALGTKGSYPKKYYHGNSKRKSKANTKTKGKNDRKRRKVEENSSSSGSCSNVSNTDSTTDSDGYSTDQSGNRHQRRHKRKHHRRRRRRDTTRESESPTGDNSADNNNASRREPSPEPLNEQQTIRPDDALPSTSATRRWRSARRRPGILKPTQISKFVQHKHKHRGGLPIQSDTRKSRSRQVCLDLDRITVDRQMSPASSNPNCICSFKVQAEEEFLQQVNNGDQDNEDNR